jgi:hypothetical protein
MILSLIFFYVLLRVPIMVNKLTSIPALSSMDYSALPLCGEQSPLLSMIPNETNRNQWQSSVESLHGDAFRVVNAIPNVTIGKDEYCRPMAGCLPDFIQESAVKAWNEAIAHRYAYNVWIDGLPSLIVSEDEYVNNVGLPSDV